MVARVAILTADLATDASVRSRKYIVAKAKVCQRGISSYHLSARAILNNLRKIRAREAICERSGVSPRRFVYESYETLSRDTIDFEPLRVYPRIVQKWVKELIKL